jgi:hypothetical protein
MRQDLSDGECNHTSKTRSPIPLMSSKQVEPSHHTQSRQSPYCHKAALEAH